MAKLYLVNECDGRSLDLDAIAISESFTGLRRFPICTDSSLENSQTMRCYRLPQAYFPTQGILLDNWRYSGHLVWGPPTEDPHYR